MGRKQKTEYIKNKEHEIEATKLQNAKCENSNEARYLRNEKDKIREANNISTEMQENTGRWGNTRKVDHEFKKS